MVAAIAHPRRMLIVVFLLLVGLAGPRLELEHGWIRPIRVHESSMAPNLHGDHLVVRCPVCARSFCVAPLDSAATDRRAVCPRCGSLHELSRTAARRRGDRVLLSDVGPRTIPSRWQIVALQFPDEADRWMVKRVVGLPSETVRLQDGDVFVNGLRLVKSMAELRSLAIPIFDTRSDAAGPSLPNPAWQRWQADGDWQFKAHGYVHSLRRRGIWSWLSFRGNDVPGRRGASALLVDDLPYNVAISRRLHPVRDFLLRCRLTDFRQGAVALAAKLQGQWLEVVWQGETRSVTLSVEDRWLAERQLVNVQTDPQATVEFSVCDGQLYFALNERTVLAEPLRATLLQEGSGIEQLRIGMRDGSGCVARIELFRDVFYLTDFPPPGSGVSGWKLAPGELLVLGDNSPVATDSRVLGPAHQSQLIGTVRPFPGRVR